MFDEYNSSFLVPDSSLRASVGSVLNLSGKQVGYNISPSPRIADMRALNADARVIGLELRRSIRNAQAKYGKRVTS